MKRILIICVNYNSYGDLEGYLQSISEAALKSQNNAEIVVAIADNTPRNLKQTFKETYPNITTQKFELDENRGYLGSAECVMAKLKNQNKFNNFDIYIVSNVDLKLKDNFFVKLISQEENQQIGWIAPDIYTTDRDKHENPFMKNRPASKKMTFWRVLYKLPIMFQMYAKIANKYTAKNRHKIDKSEIYAGHGSIMIFTQKFMRKYEIGQFPAFMYGEEIYFAELIKREGLKTMYCPEITVYNTGGVSTNLLGLARKAKMNYESLTELQKLFF